MPECLADSFIYPRTQCIFVVIHIFDLYVCALVVSGLFQLFHSSQICSVFRSISRSDLPRLNLPFGDQFSESFSRYLIAVAAIAIIQFVATRYVFVLEATPSLPQLISLIHTFALMTESTADLSLGFFGH
jgi:hypothetical protein